MRSEKCGLGPHGSVTSRKRLSCSDETGGLRHHSVVFWLVSESSRFDDFLTAELSGRAVLELSMCSPSQVGRIEILRRRMSPTQVSLGHYSKSNDVMERLSELGLPASNADLRLESGNRTTCLILFRHPPDPDCCVTAG
jgi:hypothetical protein